MKWCEVIINVLFYLLKEKIINLTVFTWFLMLDKIQDGDHVWWRHSL